MINYIENENSLIDCVKFISSFEVLKNGKITKINNNLPEYKVIISKIERLFQNSMLMPAFGVSLHGETQNAMMNGEWLKINFSKELNKNGLPFSSLVFCLEETQGFNLIREFNNRFDGRCLFLSLDEKTDLTELI